jgi:hypothetical protein
LDIAFLPAPGQGRTGPANVAIGSELESADGR